MLKADPCGLGKKPGSQCLQTANMWRSQAPRQPAQPCDACIRLLLLLNAVLTLLTALLPAAAAQPVGTPPPSVAQPTFEQWCHPEEVCEALVAIYNITSPQGAGWFHSEGWAATAAASTLGASLSAAACGNLPRSIASEAENSPTPPYCGWHGVLCCGRSNSPESDAGFDYQALLRAQLPGCGRRHAVTALNLPANGLQGALGDVSGALQHLHACGLTDVSLASNNLTGALPPALGQLANLRCEPLLINKNFLYQLAWWNRQEASKPAPTPAMANTWLLVLLAMSMCYSVRFRGGLLFKPMFRSVLYPPPYWASRAARQQHLVECAGR